MASRPLFTRCAYLWASLFVLAPLPAVAVTFVTPDTVGYNPIDTYEGPTLRMYKEQVQYDNATRKIATSSKLNVGPKVLTLPSTVTVKSPATIGKTIVRIAKGASPAAIGLATAAYLIENANLIDWGTDDQGLPLLFGNCDGFWSIGCEGEQDPPPAQDVLWQPHNSSGYPVGPALAGKSQACAVVGGTQVAGDGPTQFVCLYYGQYRGTISQRTNPCLPDQIHNNETGSCEDPTPPVYIVQLPTPEEWEDIGHVEWMEPPPEVIREVAATPQALPVEPPVIDGLPMTVPLGEPYQHPGTGEWQQPQAHLTPGADGKVGVETVIEPVTGPEGIPDPTRVGAPVTVPGDPVEVDVELCEDGSTKLGCIDAGTPEDVTIEKDEFELEFEHSPVVFTNTQCPTGPSANTPWGNVTVDMYWPCEFATAIKPIILALGAFVAVGIFVGGLRTS